tara:strand:- start:3390 stop:4463 length:1074 start_codon:yes stop_codon:yes gene_type:complete
MYSVYSKDRKSLQFPAYCDGYLQIDYSDAIAVQKTGLWGHTGSVVIETILTPYDINGNLLEGVTNAKTMERTSSYAASYFPTTDRDNARMTIIYNPSLRVSLKNTVATHLKGQPAEYAIEFILKIGTTYTTITSDTVIKTQPIYKARVGNEKYLYDNHNAYAKKVLNPDASAFVIASPNTSAKTFVIPSAAQQSFYVGQTLYSQSNEYLGTVQSPIGTTITMSETWTSTLSEVYEPVLQEALYLNIPHHIAVSYNHVNGVMSIIYNNKVVKSGPHGAMGKFTFTADDILIGKAGLGAGNAIYATSYQERRESQFIGEIHEIAISSSSQTAFMNINTLMPTYRNLLFFLDFGERDLNG